MVPQGRIRLVFTSYFLQGWRTASRNSSRPRCSPRTPSIISASGTQLLWIGDIYSFVLAALLISMGSLGDRIGHKKLLLCGATLFGIVSAITAYSSSPEMLIATRALLGMAGATLAPATLALIRGLFPDQRERSIAVGIWASAFSAGAALGPVIGGVLLEHFWWGSVFLMSVPVLLPLLVLALRELVAIAFASATSPTQSLRPAGILALV